MKKLFKALLVFACAGTLCAGALAVSACGGNKDNGAYGLVHGAGYVGYATVTVDKEDKVTDVTLTEVCLPSYVKDADGDYYAEVSYGKVTMTYDEGEGAYMVGEQTITEYFQNEANCKAYVDAVKGGNVYVNGNNNSVMTWSALCKEENGYWTNGVGLEWLGNRNATLNYVKENGVAGLLTLTQSDKIWVDSNGVSTGATWSDLNSKPAANTYLSYAQLIVNAYNKVAKTPVNA